MDWEPIVTSLSTCGILIAFAGAFLKKSFQTLDELVVKIGEIKEQLAGIVVKLANLEISDEMLREHDRKIAGLEAVVYGDNWSKSKSSSGRQGKVP